MKQSLFGAPHDIDLTAVPGIVETPRTSYREFVYKPLRIYQTSGREDFLREPQHRFRSWEDQAADDAGVPARGEI